MRIAITLEYKGTNYLGWQRNGQDRTVSYVLEQTFAKILGEEVKIVASGRTDAGVHAMAQVAHLDLPKTCKIASKSLIAEVNKNLPKDLRIVSVKEVSERFHARYNVKSKTYLYGRGHALLPQSFRYGKADGAHCPPRGGKGIFCHPAGQTRER